MAPLNELRASSATVLPPLMMISPEPVMVFEIVVLDVTSRIVPASSISDPLPSAAPELIDSAPCLTCVPH